MKTRLAALRAATPWIHCVQDRACNAVVFGRDAAAVCEIQTDRSVLAGATRKRQSARAADAAPACGPALSALSAPAIADVRCVSLCVPHVRRVRARVLAACYSTGASSPKHMRHRYTSMLLAASHATCSHAQWNQCVQQSHCTHGSPAALSATPQHCNTRVLSFAAAAAAAGAADCVFASVFALDRRRVVVVLFDLARGCAADADAGAGAASVGVEVDDGGCGCVTNLPYCAMTVSNSAFNSSSVSGLPALLSRTSLAL
jgi:hypothetical protein